jgi:nucleoside phosphorylase
MGKINGAREFEGIAARVKPGLVITAGFAGALDPALPTAAVLFDADPGTTGLTCQLLEAGARQATFHCANRVAVMATEKAELRNQTKADAVEMESGVIRSICAGLRVPSATVRVILDTAAQDLPLDFNQLMNSEMRIDTMKLVLALGRAPGKIPALLKLQQQTRSAAVALANVLKHALASSADSMPR